MLQAPHSRRSIEMQLSSRSYRELLKTVPVDGYNDLRVGSRSSLKIASMSLMISNGPAESVSPVEAPAVTFIRLSSGYASGRATSW
jgi:hypothetical protein